MTWFVSHLWSQKLCFGQNHVICNLSKVWFWGSEPSVVYDLHFSLGNEQYVLVLVEVTSLTFLSFTRFPQPQVSSIPTLNLWNNFIVHLLVSSIHSWNVFKKHWFWWFHHNLSPLHQDQVNIQWINSILWIFSQLLQLWMDIYEFLHFSMC